MSAILVLASASSARRKVLGGARVPFTHEPAGIDESAVKTEMHSRPPREIARALALAKAQAVSARRPDVLVLGADQVLEADGRLFDKPRDDPEARAQLMYLRGRAHRLVNGLALVSAGRVCWQYDDEARLWMRDFDDAFLDSYLARTGPEILESVGAYRLEGRGAQLFARIEGDFFSILGLPLLPLLEALRREGILA